MTSFEYLSVLVSIIIGLGISHLLSGAARLIQMRRRVRLHVPTFVWMALLFLLLVQIWWADFAWHEARHWSYFSFLLLLLVPALAYLLAYLLVPDLESGERIDLEASYFANRRWFFSLLALLPVISLSHQLVSNGHVQINGDLGFHAVFLGLSLAALAIRNERFHAANAFFALALFVAYVTVLFLQLG